MVRDLCMPVCCRWRGRLGSCLVDCTCLSQLRGKLPHRPGLCVGWLKFICAFVRRRQPGWREPALYHWCVRGLHFTVRVRATTFEEMLHSDNIWINADPLENTTSAWRGWPGFFRQGAKAGEMLHSYRAALVVLKSPWDCPLPAQPPIATAHFAWVECRVWGWHLAWISTWRRDINAIY